MASPQEIKIEGQPKLEGGPEVKPRRVQPPQALRDAGAGPVDPSAGLRLLLQIERDARRAARLSELLLVIANETRRAVGARQVFVFSDERGRQRLEAVSSLSAIERNAPLSRWIETVATRLAREPRVDAPPVAPPVAAPAPATTVADAAARTPRSSAGTPPAVAPPSPIAPGAPFFCDLATFAADDETFERFPFAHGLAAPIFAPSGARLGLLIAARETPFAEADRLVAQRLAETYGHAWAALGGVRRRLGARLRRPIVWLLAAAALVAVGAIPAPLTALATAEVVALDPAVIAAPIDGAIESVEVEPNQRVRAGDVLLRYVDTQARGALDVAEREVGVAQARLRQAQQMAFVDPQAKRELAVAQSDLRLKKAERAYAAEVFERSVVRAPLDGVAVFSDKRELIGRPVTTGQRIMEIADPERRQFRLQAPADDAAVLAEGARARIFMDSDPLRPIAAKLTHAAPMAKVSESGALVFRADAVAADGAETPPLGHRGTAQIVGEKVSLAFFLFRRPLSSLRQKIGF